MENEGIERRIFLKGVVAGGTVAVGSVVSQALRDADIDVPTRDIGIPRRFLDHGTRAQVHAEIGLTAQEVARRIVEAIARLEPAMDSAERPA